MKRSKFVYFLVLIIATSTLFSQTTLSAKKKTPIVVVSDREYWTTLLYKMAVPVLSNMSKGTLQKNMVVELSPFWDGRNKKVSYMEAFGRLMAGLAPWLTLPDDNTPEGLQRKQLREWALLSYANAVNPASPDYLLWSGESQVLVDAAFIANSFIRAPKQLWEPLDSLTKQRYIDCFKNVRKINPSYSNWLLFSGMTETFLFQAGAEYDRFRIDMAFRKINEWYVGDGWYSDGPDFAFDYYNSFVIQPMLWEEMGVLRDGKAPSKILNYDDVTVRMQRYASILERMVSPEGTFPVFGRSMTYRLGVFQPLALLAWREKLPAGMTNGQARAAMSACMKRMFANDSIFNTAGYLQLGFAGHQPEMADGYSNSGSEYLTSLVFLPLGLPANHPFWTDPAQDWTSKKAWNGQPISRDHALKK
ncbi:MAG: DUF2264 domain-containing protein [Bacteroidia bacterium]|nr:DUF2264 domain-containing protein [Bacteroidia bacterium]